MATMKLNGVVTHYGEAKPKKEADKTTSVKRSAKSPKGPQAGK